MSTVLALSAAAVRGLPPFWGPAVPAAALEEVELHMEAPAEEPEGNPGKVFLGGLSYESTEDSIKEHFEERYGQVLKASAWEFTACT